MNDPISSEERGSGAIADAALAKIICDIRDRSGLESVWDEIDVDTRNEIIATWRAFIVSEIQRGAL